MIERDELIAIGRYNKVHGVAGEIGATIDVPVEALHAFSCLISDMDGIYVPFYVDACRPKGSQAVLLTIDGIDSQQEASLLVGRDIYVLKHEFEQVSAEDEYEDAYPLDYFIGFDLQDSDGSRVGQITDVDEQTENAIFIIDRDGQELMVPANDDLIVEFDIDEKIMVMDLPQGLLNLNN